MIPAGLPPGPRGKLRTTFRLLRKPFEVFPAWAKEYGDPFTINAVNGLVITTGRPELIKQIFAHDPDDYAPFGTEPVALVVGPTSVFVLEGKAHKRERKLLMPPFHGERMRTYGEAMQDVARKHYGDVAGGGEIKLLDVGQKLTLEIILRAVFGVEETERLGTFADSIVDTIEAVNPVFVFAPFTAREFGGIGPYARFSRHMRRIDALIAELVAATRADPKIAERVDILSMMLAAEYDDGTKMSDQSVRDELITLVVAGHETTAITLAWVVDQLGRHPEVMKRLREELDALGDGATPADFASLQYLGAVIDETLRLFPIITEVIRTLKTPMKLGDLEIPAGCSVAASAIMAHYDPELYPDPMKFDPERFMGRKPSPFEYLPFGGGHRRCIGAAFASYELRVVLGVLLREFDIEWLDLDNGAEPFVRRNLTMAPGRGVRVKLTPRAS